MIDKRFIIGVGGVFVVTILVSMYIFNAYLYETHATSDLVISAILMIYALVLAGLGICEATKKPTP